MNEKIIKLESISPVELYGANDQNLEFLKKYFPKLVVIGRGETIKLIGELSDIISFENKLVLLIKHYNKFGSITESIIEKIMEEELLKAERVIEKNTTAISDVLVYGTAGLIIKARTENQRKMVEAIAKHDMLFAVGPAGTGKTYTAVALAVMALKNKEVKRIILTRPAVEAGENLGFLPGDLKEKLDPYLQPLYDALRDMIPSEKLASYFEAGNIQIAPLAFMRGRTLDNAFVILDEAQNATESQLKMFLTRMGKSAKFLITGDVSQIDLPKNQPSGLVQALKILKDVKGINFIHLDTSDVIRHKLVKSIIEAYDKKLN